VRERARGEPERSRELVVRGQQRAGPIEDDHASSLEYPQLVQTAFGAVEGRPNVEATESNIPGTEPPDRLLGREQDRIEAERIGGTEQPAISLR
jgi:hypothetical protein